jgi:hypothetical protein
MGDTTWQDVAEVVLNSWPAGPGSKGWERGQLDGYIIELQERSLTPAWAIVGLRACLSDFIPSAGRVLALAREKLPPLTAVDLQRAEHRHLDRARRSDPPMLDAG